MRLHYWKKSDPGDWESSTRLLEAQDTKKQLYGLMISLEESQDNNNQLTCRMKFCADENFAHVHPNIYAPKSLTNVTKLGGGGSGVTVFSGSMPRGDVIMKHGGYKDTREAFALATIAQELKLRGDGEGTMKRRLPEFQFLYISPKHLRSTSTELWKKLKKVIMQCHQLHTLSSSSISDTNGSSSNSNDNVSNDNTDNDDDKKNNTPCCSLRRRSIQVKAVGKQDSLSLIEIRKDALNILLQNDLIVSKDGKSVQYGLPGDGFNRLQSLVENIVPLQKHHLWKFTQAQKAIGGPHAVAGSTWLLQGKLTGTLLQNLIAQMVQVVRDLQRLTRPDELDILTKVRAEVEDMIQTDEVIRISPDTDAFFGNAIVKNWHPKKGRFPRIRIFGQQFRSKKDLFITPEEEVPIHHLGQILQDNSKMGITYEGAPMEDSLFNFREVMMKKLGRAVSPSVGTSPAAKRRLWTCGLADAGIHNLFLSKTDLWLFDLGEPHLESTPGFLTKFLFSFFHTLGMEETKTEDGETTWVKRFVTNENGKLELTAETKALLSQSYNAFETVLDQVITDLFDEDDSVRETLVLYVTLQLLSDASFCLERWSIKGGGRSRDSNHQKGIEKWLWRTLWDIYIAFDLNLSSNMQRLKCR